MARKKTFVTDTQLQENPALSFISQESVDAVEKARQPAVLKRDIETKSLPRDSKPPQGYKWNPEFIEVKSKRVQLVMQPSLYHRVKEASLAAGLSFNDYCHQILKQATSDKSN